jgi:hypothetical protein
MAKSCRVSAGSKKNSSGGAIVNAKSGDTGRRVTAAGNNQPTDGAGHYKCADGGIVRAAVPNVAGRDRQDGE